MPTIYDNIKENLLDGLNKKKFKSIIDKIDVILVADYRFTGEELDYITNYDIKYRIGLGE